MCRLQIRKPIPVVLQILALVLQLVACTSGGLPRASYREELYRNECVASVSSKDFPLEANWCLQLDLPITSSPKIKGDTIYINTTDAIAKSVFYAISTKTSAILWKYETEARMGNESFLWSVAGDYVIIGGPHQWVYRIEALDRHTGQRVWQTQINYIIEAIITDNDHLYIAAQNSLYQLDLSSGKALWEFQGLPSHATFRAFYNPANATIVVPADHYYIIDAHSGDLVYKGNDVYSNDPVDAVVHSDSLVYGSGIVNATDGSLRERLPGGTDYMVPAITSNTVYYVADQGGHSDTTQLISRDLGTNDVNWIYSTEVLVKSPPSRMFISDPLILGNVLYVFTKDDKLRAISLDTGHEIGQWYGPYRGKALSPQDGEHFIPPPLGMAASDKSLYVSFGTNLLYALKPR
jgi:outer membrane protein assembly factor BamB